MVVTVENYFPRNITSLMTRLGAKFHPCYPLILALDNDASTYHQQRCMLPLVPLARDGICSGNGSVIKLIEFVYSTS
jgi:hypothetical protein